MKYMHVSKYKMQSYCLKCKNKQKKKKNET